MKRYLNELSLIMFLFLAVGIIQYPGISLGTTDDCSYEYLNIFGHIEGTRSPEGFLNQYLNKAWLSKDTIRENVETELTVNGCMLRDGEKDGENDEKNKCDNSNY